jgi:hypothetical protein
MPDASCIRMLTHNGTGQHDEVYLTTFYTAQIDFLPGYSWQQ